jgi:hypothetical protein
MCFCRKLKDLRAEPTQSPGDGKTPAVEGWGFVASEGFEPPKAEPADLQSVPFGHLGN